MGPHVDFEAALSGVPFGAALNLASEWPGTGVGHFVCLQVALGDEIFHANAALEGPMLCVGPYVRF